MESQRYAVWIDGEPRERSQSLNFMLQGIFESREALGHRDQGDASVNIHLAFLLHSLFDGEFFERFGGIVSSYPTEVAKHLEMAPDRRARFLINKANGDYALVSAGIFDRPLLGDRRRQDSALSWKSVVEHGKFYYRGAASLSERINRNHPGITSVLHRLSSGFENYLDILNHMGHNYLNLSSRISEGEFFHLERCANALEGVALSFSEEGMDFFLDAYNSWLKGDRSEASRLKINALAAALRRIKPGFDFKDL